MKTIEINQKEQEQLQQLLEMHTFGETGAGVPAFLAKLWRLVDDPDTNNMICWSKDGRSFIIQNQAQFARELLPLNYKHNNMASFIRQLNMYGFHKITSIDNGGLKFDRDEMEFSHPCFKRNCPHLLENIKRKIANTKNVEDKSLLKTEAVSKVLLDVKAMKGRQDSLDNRFSAMKQENEALWREIASLRQKHAKQQQIVNKLIQFLITIVQPSRNMGGVNRGVQLMINDTPQNGKIRQTSECESDCGPVIHELEEELLDEVEQELMNPNSPYMRASSAAGMDAENLSPLNLERPHSSISLASQNYDYSNQSGEDAHMAHTIAENAFPASAIIQSVNPDGTQSVYHVTEVPDAHPQETVRTASTNYNDENVLTTPMVREQIARNNLLKQKNKQRRREDTTGTNTTQSTNMNNLMIPTKLRRTSKPVPSTNVAQFDNNQLNIKLEKEVDPMLFLNAAYSEPAMLSPDPRYSPNLLDGNSPSSMSPKIMNPAVTATTPTNDNENINGEGNNMFGQKKLSANTYEDSALMANDANNYVGNNLKSNQTGTQMPYATSANGQFSSFMAGNNVNGGAADSNFASTSAAAAANGNVNKNMVVTKYKNDDILRLSTATDVHGHLDNVQDELDSLKELLRSDNYSLDTSTLINLFNDSDILGPYGLGLPNEESNDKKGSELMTYQPTYDLMDIMNINDKSNLDVNDESNNGNQQMPALDSELNTPYHA